VRIGRRLPLVCVCLVSLGLVITGCAQTRPSGSGLFGRRAKPAGDGPPAPAPALYIPGPVGQTPTAESPGLATPQAAIQQAAFTETLPLQVPQASDPAYGAAALPPLIAPTRGGVPTNAIAPFHELYQKAAQTYASMDSYTVRLRRREVVGNVSHPEEVLLFKWRREPWSVYFKWLGAEGKGREVIYVKGHYEGALHTLTAAGDLPLLPAGRHIKVSPDGVLVRSKSRYPITQAGLGVLVERFGKIVENQEKGDVHEGSLKYLGQIKRPEYERNVEGVLQIIPAKGDPNLPRGGQRHWFFEPESHLPMLLITQDETGREVEYYCHDRFMFPVHLTDDDFNPDLLWKTAAKN
jgi:hypothetical protein